MSKPNLMISDLRTQYEELASKQEDVSQKLNEETSEDSSDESTLRIIHQYHKKNQSEKAFDVKLPEQLRLQECEDLNKCAEYLDALVWLYSSRVDKTYQDSLKLKCNLLRIYESNAPKQARSRVPEPSQARPLKERQMIKQIEKYGLDTLDYKKNICNYDTVQLNPFYNQTSKSLDMQDLSTLLIYKPQMNKEFALIIDPDQLIEFPYIIMNQGYIKLEIDQTPMEYHYNESELIFSDIQEFRERYTHLVLKKYPKKYQPYNVLTKNQIEIFINKNTIDQEEEELQNKEQEKKKQLEEQEQKKIDEKEQLLLEYQQNNTAQKLDNQVQPIQIKPAQQSDDDDNQEIPDVQDIQEIPDQLQPADEWEQQYLEEQLNDKQDLEKQMEIFEVDEMEEKPKKKQQKSSKQLQQLSDQQQTNLLNFDDAYSYERNALQATYQEQHKLNRNVRIRHIGDHNEYTFYRFFEFFIREVDPEKLDSFNEQNEPEQIEQIEQIQSESEHNIEFIEDNKIQPQVDEQTDYYVPFRVVSKDPLTIKQLEQVLLKIFDHIESPVCFSKLYKATLYVVPTNITKHKLFAALLFLSKTKGYNLKKYQSELYTNIFNIFFLKFDKNYSNSIVTWMKIMKQIFQKIQVLIDKISKT